MTGPYKTTTIIKGYEIEQTYHEPVFPFDAERVRSVKIIAFDDEGKILGIKRGRTFDIPCGQLEWDDDNFQDTAKREVYEQANVNLGQITLAAVIAERIIGTIEHEQAYEAVAKFRGKQKPEANQKDKKYQKQRTRPAFTLVMTGGVQEIEPLPHARDIKRGFFDKETFLDRYRFGNRDDLRKLIEMADFALPPKSKRENAIRKAKDKGF